MEWLRLSLAAHEYEALVRLAEREVRPVPDQARVVLRDRLRRTGLLKPTADDRKTLEPLHATTRRTKAVAR